MRLGRLSPCSSCNVHCHCRALPHTFLARTQIQRQRFGRIWSHQTGRQFPRFVFEPYPKNRHTQPDMGHQALGRGKGAPCLSFWELSFQCLENLGVCKSPMLGTTGTLVKLSSQQLLPLCSVGFLMVQIWDESEGPCSARPLQHLMCLPALCPELFEGI